MNGNGKHQVERDSESPPAGDPFSLIFAVFQTASKCLRDPDPCPYAIVVDRDSIGDVTRIANVIDAQNCGVTVDIVPDQGNKDRAVVLFSRAKGKR